MRRARWSRWQRWLLLATAAASALVMTATAGLSLFFRHLNANIATQSMTVLGKLPPPSKAGVLNILALGSQTRDGRLQRADAERQREHLLRPPQPQQPR